MKVRACVTLLAALLLPLAAVAQKTNVDWDRQADFSKFHTYAWEKSPDPAHGLWDQRIVNAVDQQMMSKGFKQVATDPDVWVVYSNSMHDQKQVVGTNYGFGPGWGWGWGWGQGPVTYNTYITKKGTLVVEIADARNKQLLWRGAVTDTISDNSDKNIKTLDKAVAKLFQGYPPKEKK